MTKSNLFFLTYTTFCVKYFLSNLLNNFLDLIGYIQVYDLIENKNVSLNFYFQKLLAYIFKINISMREMRFGFIYPVIGITMYNHGRRIKYICYNSTLIEAVNYIKPKPTSRYANIKNVEYQNSNKSDWIDVTPCVMDFYDTKDYVRIRDIVKMHLLMKHHELFDIYCVKVTKEIFNEDLCEMIAIEETII